MTSSRRVKTMSSLAAVIQSLLQNYKINFAHLFSELTPVEFIQISTEIVWE